MNHQRHRSRRGITLIEAMMAVSITTIAGTALLTAIGTTVKTTGDSAYALIGSGLAEQLMDEIAATRFPTANSSLTTRRSDRTLFDDIDDYASWKSQPPINREGKVLGTEGYRIFGYEVDRLYQMRPNWNVMNRISREVQVERIVPGGSGGWTVTRSESDFRRVTVTVFYTNPQGDKEELAVISRTFSYVPSAF